MPITDRIALPDFHPHPFLRHQLFMTLAPRYLPRRNLLRGVPTEARLFTVAPHSRMLGYCHWQAERQQRPTVLLLHGLEGSSESHYMRGIAAKAWRAGMNVIRLNQRNCGGTEHLSATLYNSGLSDDYRAVIAELAQKDGLERMWMVGYSMGGNLILKMAGEVGESLQALKGVIAVCPTIEPAVCVAALEQPRNFLYHLFFVKRVKERLRRKARLFPDSWDTSRLPFIRTIRQFDHHYTAPDGGYESAEEYYERVAARHVLAQIRVPTLIITAQNDPLIPHSCFEIPAISQNPAIILLAPAHGGHCGFYQRPRLDEDAYWAENRIIELVKRHSAE